MWGDGRDHDRELEFWWETLAYWDDYVAGTKTFDRKGAGSPASSATATSTIAARPPGRRCSRSARFLDGLDLETNGRAVVAFDANGDGALDVYVRSVGAPEALFLGTPPAGRALPADSLRGGAGRDNRDGIGVAVDRDPPRRPP